MTREMLLVFGVLVTAVVLFSTERLRVDVVAFGIMLVLPWLGLLEAKQAFSGFSSNAVLALMGVMVMGAGIEATGLMNRVALVIIRMAGDNERKLCALSSAFVGSISAFMQNIGAVALFLPALLGISRKTGIPASRLLMPMGFAAILGGTLTLVASGPMIILNDLLKQASLPPLGLFSVTPLGALLLVSGILYFFFLGKAVLPGARGESPDERKLFAETWGLPSAVVRLEIPRGSAIAGRTLEEASLWQRWGLHLLFVEEKGGVAYAPWRQSAFTEGQVLGVSGASEAISAFTEFYGLKPLKAQPGKEAALLHENASFAQYVVLPRSPMAGKSIRDIALRKNFGVEPLVLLSGESESREDFSDRPLKAGDALVVHGPWENLYRLGKERGIALVTPLSGRPLREKKTAAAAAGFLGSIGLAVAGFPISLSLMTGALAMVLTRVLSMDEAYEAIDWKTVFLLAGLIPLGLAMDQTGGARFLAEKITGIAAGAGPMATLLVIAGLSTVFSLFMSNIAATVLLVPFSVVVARESGLDPRALAMLVAVCVANSFVLPTHQVNALLLSPGGYRNADFLKAGGFMTVIFIVVAVTATRFFYL